MSIRPKAKASPSVGTCPKEKFKKSRADALPKPPVQSQNGTDESFNGTLRNECLSMEWFRNRTEAAVVIETWRRHYNDVRPHSSLDYRTPSEFKRDIERKYTDQRSTRREPTFQESVVH